jgi:hypothetical protein
MLQFVVNLCKGKDQVYKDLLENNIFRIIVNANPNGRIGVEKGDYCKRSNSNNVDINRNWDIHHKEKITIMDEENPGNKPFSELETLFVHKSIEKFNAKLFLTIHSGFYGLFLPYAFEEEEGTVNIDNMKKVLTELQGKYCSVCGVGSPSKLLKYQSSGTCLDYIYSKLNVPYSLAWEIYTDEIELPSLKKKQQENQSLKYSFKDKPKNYINKQDIINSSDHFSNDNSILKERTRIVSNFLAIEEKEQVNNNVEMDMKRGKRYSSSENDLCAHLFNPLDKLSYDFILDNWHKVYIFLILGVNRSCYVC